MKQNDEKSTGSELLHYIISLCLGYLIGSFPTAYVLVKNKAGLDIRKFGSGNIGARNALDVTGSKLMGIIVLILDLLKGGCAVYFSSLIYGNEFWLMGIAGIGAILGHNYSLWVKFKGGRGLATAAGVMLLLGWMYVVLWLIIYGICQIFTKHIHLSSVVASIVSPFFLLLIQERQAGSILFFQSRLSDVFALSVILSSIILLRHIEPIKEFIIEQKKYPHESIRYKRT